MKRKAEDELIADRPPPMPAEMELAMSAAPAADSAAAPAPATTWLGTELHTEMHTDFQPQGSEPTEDHSDTPVTSAHTPASAPSAPSVSAVTATTAASRRFPSDLKTIRCTWPDCQKTFNRPARLTAHMRSHTNDRPFKCPDCTKTYLEEKHLRQHIKGSHSQERRYVCGECHKAFLTATRLRRHAAVHEGQDRFRCKGYDDTCTRTFRKHQTLQRHIRVDHLKQPAFCCTHAGSGGAGGAAADRDTCGALFDSAGALRRHVERAHAAPKFWCEECAALTSAGAEGAAGAAGVGFATRTLLESHMRHEHANCPFCDARCAGPAELHRHVDMHHSGKSVADRKTIACPHAGCSKTFTRRANRNVHIRAVHQGLRFVCGTSGRGGSADADEDEDEDEDDDADADVDADGGRNGSRSVHPEMAAWLLRGEGCGRGFVSKMKLQEHILYVHLGHDRPAPLLKAAEPLLLDASAAAAGHDYDFDGTDGADKESNIIAALLGTNRTLVCTMPDCTARFVRHHDLNMHIQRDHFVLSDAHAASDVHDEANAGSSALQPDDFWIGSGGGGGGGDASDDMFGAFIDMNAGILSATSMPMLYTDDVEWQMNEAEMRQLIGAEGGARGEVSSGSGSGSAALDSAGIGGGPGVSAPLLDPDLFL